MPALGTFAFGEATRTGLLSVVPVVATLNPVVTVVLAHLPLRDRPAPVQRLGGGARAGRDRAADHQLITPPGT